MTADEHGGSTSPASTEAIPDGIAVAAHRGLHTMWQLPGQALPSSGFGCPECLPDIRVILAPVWGRLRRLFATPDPATATPDGASMYDLAREASVALHNTCSAAPIQPGSGRNCGECIADIETVLDHIWDLTRAHVTAPSAPTS